MPWLPLDDGFPDHPKIIGLSDAAFRLHVAALCYAHRARTDGFIPTGWVGRQHRAATHLVAARLWVPDPEEDGWLIHDYLGWNPSRAEVEDMKRRASEAGKRGAAKRWGHDRDTP